jgi:hypothetical protein
MFKIVVTSPEVKEIKGVSAKGRAWTMRFQRAYLATVDRDGVVGPIPDRFEFLLPDDVATGYAPGEYSLHPSSLAVGLDGKLVLQPFLSPLKVAPAARA